MNRRSLLQILTMTPFLSSVLKGVASPDDKVSDARIWEIFGLKGASSKSLPDGPICAAIHCSKDKVPGAYIWDLVGCSSLEECFKSALKRSEEIKVDADQIFLLRTSELFVSCKFIRDEKESAFYSWTKIDWVSLDNSPTKPTWVGSAIRKHK